MTSKTLLLGGMVFLAGASAVAVVLVDGETKRQQRRNLIAPVSVAAKQSVRDSGFATGGQGAGDAHAVTEGRAPQDLDVVREVWASSEGRAAVLPRAEGWTRELGSRNRADVERWMETPGMRGSVRYCVAIRKDGWRGVVRAPALPRPRRAPGAATAPCSIEVLDGDDDRRIEALLFDATGLPLGSLGVSSSSLVTVPFEGVVAAAGFEPRPVQLAIGGRGKKHRVKLLPSATASGRLTVGAAVAGKLLLWRDGPQEVVDVAADGRFRFGPVGRGGARLSFLGDGFLDGEIYPIRLQRGYNDLGLLRLKRYGTVVLHLRGEEGRIDRLRIARHYPARKGALAVTRKISWYVREEAVSGGVCRYHRVHPGPARLTVWSGDGQFAETGRFVVGASGDTAISVALQQPGSLKVRAVGPVDFSRSEFRVALADCGCLGAQAVPAWAVWFVIGAGTVLLVASGTGVGRRPPRSQCAAAAGLAVLAWLPGLRSARPFVETAAVVGDLVRAVDAEGWGQQDLILLGSWDCDHCLQVLREIEAARTSAGQGVEVHLVQRESDAARSRVGRRWVRTHRVADRLWWRAIEARPPRFLRRGAAGRWRFVETWRGADAGASRGR